ncbi:hypothetical protein [Butyrivibrio sp. VCB2006]|uniref:hypothetical protein n=1 Tax=Butyrivibrio sp. VCB2006 TaxID=1280679 RepID=UPI0004027E2E|nr:hypothetical protein [Butyrivibrio sp. VCB2006]
MLKGAKGNKHLVIVLIHTVVLAFLILFFARWTPLVMYDFDDWFRSGKIRIPVPMWGAWEPTRIFPEVAMPIFTGRLGAWVFYPITGDYIYSLTIASAVTMSAMILVMCICFYKLLANRLGCSTFKTLVLEGMFLASFFLMFRNRSGSKFLFHSSDLCTVYYYTMGGLLNAILLLILLEKKDATKAFRKMPVGRKIALSVLIYFAVFSNLFHSAITVVYCGTVILIDWVKEKSVVSSIRRNALQFAIILLWGVVLIFEFFGGRSDSFEQDIDLVLSIRQFLTLIGAMAIAYKIIVAFCLLGFLWLLFKKKELGLLPVIVISGFFETVFLLLLNSKVLYMSRIEASWGTWFYLILFCVIVCSYAIDNWDKLVYFAPVALCVMIFFSWYPDGKFAISSTRNPDYQQCYDTSTYIAQSIIDADKAGEKELTLKLPVSDNPEEFTFVPDIGSVVSDTLYRQRVIKHLITVNVEFDESLNEKYLPHF